MPQKGEAENDPYSDPYLFNELYKDIMYFNVFKQFDLSRK